MSSFQILPSKFSSRFSESPICTFGPLIFKNCNLTPNFRKICESKGITVIAYSPLGAVGTFYGTNRVMESQMLNEISKAKGKSVAQMSLRWAYEQGIGVVAKSFNKERLKQNSDIFDWSLSSEEVKKISEIPQERLS